MAIYSIHELKGKTRTRSFSQKKSIVNESRKFETFDIFLSHSIKDEDAVENLFYELSDFGYSVYVDWLVDPDLDRNNVTKESAERIRSRMKSSKTLLLALSDSVSLSKWVPWELGFLDGRTNNCALLPISDYINPSSIYHRSEYLKLYPYIDKERLAIGGEGLFVVDAADRYSSLREFVFENKKPYQRNIKLF